MKKIFCTLAFIGVLLSTGCATKPVPNTITKTQTNFVNDPTELVKEAQENIKGASGVIEKNTTAIDDQTHNIDNRVKDPSVQGSTAEIRRLSSEIAGLKKQLDDATNSLNTALKDVADVKVAMDKQTKDFNAYIDQAKKDRDLAVKNAVEPLQKELKQVNDNYVKERNANMNHLFILMGILVFFGAISAAFGGFIAWTSTNKVTGGGLVVAGAILIGIGLAVIQQSFWIGLGSAIALGVIIVALLIKFLVSQYNTNQTTQTALTETVKTTELAKNALKVAAPEQANIIFGSGKADLVQSPKTRELVSKIRSKLIV